MGAGGLRNALVYQAVQCQSAAHLKVGTANN